MPTERGDKSISDRPKSLMLRVITSESDCGSLARVRHAAFKDSPLDALMYPVQNEDALREMYEKREGLELSDPSNVLVAVTDTSLGSPTIIAYARWHLPRRLIKAVQQNASSPPGAKTESLTESYHNMSNHPPLPAGSNASLDAAFLEELATKRSMHFDTENDYR